MIGVERGIDMSVDPDLARLVARTLENTDRLLEDEKTSWDVAVTGVGKVIADLANRYPQHSDWIEKQYAEWRRKHGH